MSSKIKKPFIYENGEVKKWSQANDCYTFVAKYIWLKQRLQAIDDGTWYVKIGYKDPNGVEKDLMLPQEQIKRNDLLSYMGFGIDITEGNVTDVRTYLNYCLRNYKKAVKNVHKSLGWLYKDGERTNVFLLDEAIGGDIESTYIGNVNIKPKGDLDKYVDFIKKELEDNPYLQLALVFALCAPILSIVSVDNDMENLFINISGDSSKGKSTSLSLGMSVWGKASVSDGKGSLIQSWSSTENAMFKSISSQKLNGFPICRDECGANNVKNFNKFYI